MKELELEKTYLARFLPDGLPNCEHKDLLDIYLPETATHPRLRIRQKGHKFEITKKSPLISGDASQQIEQTIPLEEAEFKAFLGIKGKRLHKIRYLYPYQSLVAEIDVFQGDLAGLVLVDFEFKTVDAMKSFTIPDFCLADVTQEEFVAGGMLCGKTYADIEPLLHHFGYQKITQISP